MGNHEIRETHEKTHSAVAIAPMMKHPTFTIFMLAVATVFTVSAKADVDLLDGLQGRWGFDEPYSPMVTRNTGARFGLLDGTLLGATTSPGKFDSAVTLSGGAYVDIPGLALPSGAEAYTWSAWVKNDASDSSQHYALETSGSWAVSGRIDLNTNQYHVFAQTTSDTGGITDVSYPASHTGGWHHMAVTYAANDTIRFYLDGSLVGQDAVTGSLTSTTGLHIGADRNGGRTWTGQIDEVGVWDRVLNVDEVAYLFGGGQGNLIPQAVNTDFGLAAHWDFNESKGTIVRNVASTQSRYDGTLLGGAALATSGRFGSGLSLAGSGGYVDVDESLFLTESDGYALSTWFRFSGSGTGGATLLESSGGGTFSVGLSSNDFLQYAVQDDVGILRETSVSPTADTWHQAVLSYDRLADVTKLYYDGVELDAFRGDPTGGLAASDGFHIGASGAADDFFAGMIDDVAVWQRPLNDAEVAYLWNDGEGREVAGTAVEPREWHTNGVTAHRGLSGSQPENTIPAFEAAIEAAADWIELDIYKTADGKIVVIHDSTTDRTGDLNLVVAQSTYEQLLQVDVAADFRQRNGLTLEECPVERIPLLEEVLALVARQENTRVSIQPKQDIVDDAVALIQSMGVTDWVGFNEGSLARCARVKQLAPEIPVFYDVSAGDVADPIQQALQYGFESVVMYYTGVTASTVEQLHAAGLEAGAWTVNDPAQIKRLLDLGVDRVYTDEADVMHRWLAEPHYGEPALAHYGTNDPTAEGWSVAGNATGVAVGSVEGRAWMIDDNSGTLGKQNYYTTLSGDQLEIAETDGWRYSFDLKIVDEPTAADGAVQAGVVMPEGRKFIVTFGAEDDGDPVLVLLGDAGEDTFVLDGFGPGYHIYEWFFDPISQTIDLYADDLLVALNHAGASNPGTFNQVFWGSNSGDGVGAAYYRIVEFEVGAGGPGASIEGDLNGDGLVGSADLDIVRSAWGQSVSAGDWLAGDPSGDGIVGSADLDIIRANWGNAASAAAVPEPGLCCICLAACGFVLIQRRNVQMRRVSRG